MEKEIAVRMDDLVAECCGYGHSSPVDQRSGSGGSDRVCMTDIAAHLFEEIIAVPDCIRDRPA